MSLPALIAVGDDDASLEEAVRATRAQIAFYASTPGYRAVLDLHGWGAVHERLNAASRRGEWAAMADAVPDEMLHTFAAVGGAAEVAAQLRERFAGVVTRLSFSASYPVAAETWRTLLAALRAPA